MKDFDDQPHDLEEDPHGPRDIEAEAAALLQHLEYQHAIENPPAINRATIIRPLVEELQTTLDYTADTDPEVILTHQAKALDSAFRRLLGDADTLYEGDENCDFQPMKYAAAFKAQEQFRRTLNTLRAIKQKPKRDKRTEGS